MDGGRDLIVGVSRSRHVRVRGTFMRHTSVGRRPLDGSQGGGRWGPPGAFAVLYLGRPKDSVVVEAYRHLIDPFDGITPDMVQPRNLVTADVDVTEVLDLTDAPSCDSLGLSTSDLHSKIGAYDKCWAVARAAHQLGLHGILAPAATGLGETLALFEAHLPPTEQPTLLDETLWSSLPPDPRKIRDVTNDVQGGHASS